MLAADPNIVHLIDEGQILARAEVLSGRRISWRASSVDSEEQGQSRAPGKARRQAESQAPHLVCGVWLLACSRASARPSSFYIFKLPGDKFVSEEPLP